MHVGELTIRSPPDTTVRTSDIRRRRSANLSARVHMHRASCDRTPPSTSAEGLARGASGRRQRLELRSEEGRAKKLSAHERHSPRRNESQNPRAARSLARQAQFLILILILNFRKHPSISADLRESDARITYASPLLSKMASESGANRYRALATRQVLNTAPIGAERLPFSHCAALTSDGKPYST